MDPRAYSTPLIFFFQMGLPNQIAKRSIFSPRQRAARKCPSSCTKMSRLKSTRTSKKIKINFKIDICSKSYPKFGTPVNIAAIMPLERWKTGEPEIRNPRAEIRKKSEIRGPKGDPKDSKRSK